MSEKKPLPMMATAPRRACPICRKTSYSASGIHPQCALLQADGPRNERIRNERKAAAAKKASTTSKKIFETKNPDTLIVQADCVDWEAH
jgi:hypothetical protein